MVSRTQMGTGKHTVRAQNCVLSPMYGKQPDEEKLDCLNWTSDNWSTGVEYGSNYGAASRRPMCCCTAEVAVELRV